MTKKTKAEKIARQDYIEQALQNGTFNKLETARKWHVLERTIRRDIAEIVERMPPYDERLALIRHRAAKRVSQRLPEMTDTSIIKLLSVGMAQRYESREEILIDEKIEETVTFNVSEDEDEILSKAAAILARKDRAGSLH